MDKGLLQRIASNKNSGFTLLEILIALFIFTILSVMLVGALHNVINIHGRTESHAERLRELQRAMLIMSRDIEQTLNRPVRDAYGREQPAFIGNREAFALTHGGFANPTGRANQSSLQRTEYTFQEQSLQRKTWPVLDLAPKSKMQSRSLLSNVGELRFEYLDKDGRFHDTWPLRDQKVQVLPRAVRIYLTLPDRGKMSQLYVIPAQ